MAERLTEKDKYGNNAIFQNKDKFTIAKDKNNDIRVYGKAIDKLAQLEDIMAKYGIESIQELESRLKSEEQEINDLYRNQLEYEDLQQDRDTWQKACELACEKLNDCFNDEQIENGFCYRVDTFYQQAKTEGNDERN